jgi:hypothetical protein
MAFVPSYSKARANVTGSARVSTASTTRGGKRVEWAGHEDDQSCLRLGSISCRRQFREVASAGTQVDSAVGAGNWGGGEESAVVAGGEHDA